MSNLTVENVYTRHTAKELAKKHFWKLLGMMLTVGAICVAIAVAGLAVLLLTTGGPWSSTAYSTNELGTNVSFFVGWLAVMIITMLVASGLGLGLTRAVLDLCRGDETVTVGRVFSRMKHCLKAVGLSLWVGLKVIVWALPVYAVLVVAALLIISANGSASSASEVAYTAIMILPFLAMIAIFVLVIPAYYRYMLSNYVLADEPSTGIRDCVKQSKAMMKGHKWQAFKLIIPLVLIMYAISFGLALVIGILSATMTEMVAINLLTTISSLLSAIVSLYFSIRMTVCYCLFYLKRREEQNPPAPEATE